MKSCLKSPTPPLSPYMAETPTPGDTPGECARRPPLRKMVSFCADDELEEVFEVEDWDRSPLPVTPKLSYEDVLELKQLRLSLPLPAPQPISAPSSRPFPYSRFATQPSQTPSKWKNRGTALPPSASLDPAILPYLDAVPIRLLPLLDTPPTPEPPSPQLLAEAEAITRTDSPSISVSSPPPQRSSVKPPPPPSSPSTEPGPSPLPSSPVASHAVSRPTSASPAAPAAPSQPARRIPTFSFVPLLPPQPAPPPASEPVRPPPPPQRRINMTFVPLVAPPSPPSAPLSLPSELTLLQSSSGDTRNGSVPSKEVVEETVESELAATPTLAPIPAPPPSPPVSSILLSTPNALTVGLGLETGSGEELFQDADADEPDAYNDLPPRALSPTDLSTPALSSASESDTDEHDGDTDADEADRPNGYAHPALAEYEYFAARLQSSSAGQTPPLSSMYPELRAALQEGEGEGGGTMPVSMSMSVAALKKVKLAALPSPALAPPSPFSLYPPTLDAGTPPFGPKQAIVSGERKAVVVGESVMEGEDTLEVDLQRLRMGEESEERTR